MVGGEAFPAALAKELRSATQGDITNMYGPTETTIWSSTQTVSGDGSAVPIGRPIANTQLYILDDNCQPVAIGATGELYIAGDGVVRGYHERPELTAERFVVDPFSSVPQARMYRTGDLARYAEDGTVEFLGRCDFQVKLRGYRIELGEIEAHIAEANEVSDAVVIAREDVPGDKRLVAYILEKRNAGSVDKEALRARLKEALPDYMVPHNFVVLDKFPLTPNAKVDRKALPAPAKMETLSSADYVEPTGDLETRVAAVWADALNVKQVGMNDNFFDLGGHSLLIVQVHRTLAKELEQKLSLTDLFRFPTIRSLVDFVQSDGGSAEMEQSKTRAASRKAAMSRRAKLRDRRRKA
jgi:acyl carrier protein